MGNVRIGRVNEEMLRVLSKLLRTIKDPRVGEFVSVTHVEAAPDFKTAKVFISTLGDEKARRDCLRGLSSASGYLRRALAGEMRLRYTPELTFSEDKSINEGMHIMELISDVTRKEDKKRNLDLEQTAEYLKGCDDILILTHKSPDGDTSGSAAALCIILRAIGKNAFVFKNPEFTEKLRKVTRAYLAPEDFVPRTVISVDCADEKLICKGAEEYKARIALAIDHHGTHRPFAGRIHVEEDAAACGEIIFDLAEILNVKFTKRLATALYVAISTDTGCFVHGNTTAETHRKAAALLEKGADFVSVNRTFFVEKSTARMKLEAELVCGMTMYFGGCVSVIRLTEEMVKRAHANEDDTDNISSITRQIAGVELGIYLREREGGVKISMRSSEKINAAELCANFGGGGHPCAAGCSVDMSIEDAEREIISYIQDTGVFA